MPYKIPPPFIKYGKYIKAMGLRDYDPRPGDICCIKDRGTWLNLIKGEYVEEITKEEYAEDHVNVRFPSIPTGEKSVEQCTTSPTKGGGDRESEPSSELETQTISNKDTPPNIIYSLIQKEKEKKESNNVIYSQSPPPIVGDSKERGVGGTLVGDSELLKEEIEGKPGQKKITRQDVHKVFNKWYYIHDPEYIDLLIAFFLSHSISSDPVWLMVIGQSSGFKTEAIKAFDALPFVVHSNQITVNTLISGQYIRPDIRYTKLVDLAPRLMNKVWIMWDFSTILGKPKDSRAELFAQLRDLYDGRISKATGATGETIEYGSGKDICYTWFTGKGKDREEHHGVFAPNDPIHCSFLTACTNAIDYYSSEHEVLGTRFLQFRLKSVEGEKVMAKIDTTFEEIENARKECRSIVTDFFLSFRIKEVVVTDAAKKTLHELTDFLCKMRTPVMLNRFNGEVEALALPEGPGRVYFMLRKLYVSFMQLDGYTEEMATNLLWRIAKSSATETRMRVFDSLTAASNKKGNMGDGVTTTDLHYEIKIGEGALKRELNALYLLGLADHGPVMSYGMRWSINNGHLRKEKTEEEPPQVKDLFAAQVKPKRDNRLIVLGLLKTYSDINDLADAAVHEGIQEEDLDKILGELRVHGDVWEKSPGEYKLVEGA